MAQIKIYGIRDHLDPDSSPTLSTRASLTHCFLLISVPIGSFPWIVPTSSTLALLHLDTIIEISMFEGAVP